MTLHLHVAARRPGTRSKNPANLQSPRSQRHRRIRSKIHISSRLTFLPRKTVARNASEGSGLAQEPAPIRTRGIAELPQRCTEPCLSKHTRSVGSSSCALHDARLLTRLAHVIL